MVSGNIFTGNHAFPMKSGRPRGWFSHEGSMIGPSWPRWQWFLVLIWICYFATDQNVPFVTANGKMATDQNVKIDGVADILSVVLMNMMAWSRSSLVFLRGQLICIYFSYCWVQHTKERHRGLHQEGPFMLRIAWNPGNWLCRRVGWTDGDFRIASYPLAT